MRALSTARSLHGVMRQAAWTRPVQSWIAAVVPQRRRAARERCLVPQTRCSSSSSSSSSSSNGWLLDTGSSLDSSETLASNGNGSTSRYDAIMMLGGGLLPDGGLPEWVVRRLEGCLHLYQQQQSSCPIVLLGAGTPHKPPVLDSHGYILYESTAYASYLMQRGVPAADLLKEAQSYDTVGNGYFSLLMHALPAGWRRIAVVTSDFHMPRTQATFEFIYGLAGRQLHGVEGWFSLDYRPVSDEGLFDPEVLEARAEKEAAAVVTWHKNTSGMRSLADLHHWLYATHLCYSVSRQHEFGRRQELDAKLAATY